MARYDWPSSRVGDDPAGRAAFREMLQPAPAVRNEDGSLDPLPTARPVGGPVVGPEDAPVGLEHLWLPVGPNEVVYGQATNRPSISGRIRDIAVEPTIGARAYAAAAGGGVWFTNDGGASWRPLNEFHVSPNRDTVTPMGSALASGSLYVRFGAATSGADDEVFYGTGEEHGSGSPGSSPSPHPGKNLVGIGIAHAIGPATGTAWQLDQGGDQLRGETVARIVASPADPEHLFAATSDGLWHRPAGASWSKIGSGSMVDLVVTQPSATELRIWITRFSRLEMASMPLPPSAGMLVFAAVNLANSLPSTNKALALGAPNELWVLSRRTRLDPNDKFDPAHLWRIDPTATPPVAVEINGLPPGLFGGVTDQSFYDICVAVHPDDTNRLYIGGSGLSTRGAWNAGLYRLAVSGTTATPTHIGVGVHADVHVIRVGALINPSTDRSVWVGCDGGIFLSAADGAPDTFVTRNFELATLEPGFVASHPTNDGLIAAGMQDNGTCERVGDAVWRITHLGDGGGTVYDPAHPHRFYRQYIHANWESSDGSGTPPVHRRYDRGDESSETIENAAADFYSGASALRHGGTTHLLIGTNRPWYSPDWGANWITIPSDSDPRATDNVNLAQDVIDPTVNGTYTDTVPTFLCCTGEVTGAAARGAEIITTRLSVADRGGQTLVRAHCLWSGGLSTFLGRKPDTDGQPWIWVAEHEQRFDHATDSAASLALRQGDDTRFLPLRRGTTAAPVTDVAPHLPMRGLHGSCYVTTAGGFASSTSGTAPILDTVWWFDGDGNWYPCGVRHLNTRGNWGAATRIVAPAIAVVVDPLDPSVVFVGTSVGVIRGKLSFVDDGGRQRPNWSWTGLNNGLPETAVNDLSIFVDPPDVSGTRLRLLRAALHGRGVWEVDLATPVAAPRTFVRVYPTDTRRRRPTPLTGPTTNGEPSVRFDASPDIYIDTTAIVDGPLGPSEADIYRGDSRRSAPVVIGGRTFRVRVLVHHRSSNQATPLQVKVALLCRDLDDGETDPPIGTLWATMVSVVGDAAPPATLPAGWQLAGGALTERIAAPTDARRPRTATFDVDLTGHGDGRVMFLAVVLSDLDPLAAADAIKAGGDTCATVRELVVHSRHVAARLVELD